MKKHVSLMILVVSISLGALSYSCTNSNKPQGDETEVIKIDTKDKSIGNPIKISKLIALETNEDCLVGSIRKIVYSKNRIILLDRNRSKAMFIFDENGKFLFKTTKGKGPGEISNPTALNVDKQNSTILLYEQSIQSFSRFDLNGNFIESRSLAANNGRLFISSFFSIGLDTLLIFHANVSDYFEDVPRRTTCSLLTEELSKVEQFDMTLNGNKNNYYVINPVARDSNQVLFVIPWSYDIYSLYGTDYRIKYTIDFGNAAIPYETREQLSARALHQHMIENKKIGCLVSVMLYEKDILVIDADHGSGSKVFIHSLATGRTINLDNYIQKGFLPKCKVRGLTENGTMYATVKPEDFIHFSQQNKYFSDLQITINSNPILFTFQIDELF